MHHTSRRPGWALCSILLTVTLALTLALAACGTSTGTGATATPTATAAPTAPTPTPTSTSTSPNVTIQNFAFNPTILMVKVGTAVHWTNADTVTHTVTSDSMVFDHTVLARQTFSFTFTHTGSFPYHCNIHHSMTATIIVTA